MEIMKQCIVCGKAYTNPGRQCNSCRCKKWKVNNRERYLQLSSQYNKKHWEKTKPVHEKKRCEFCGKQFMPNKHTPNQPYCSAKCRLARFKRDNYERIAEWKRAERETHKERYQATNAAYKDKIRFSGNRKKALERDNHTCQECGSQAKGLNVHHLDWSGQSDNPNNELSNLQTLCRPCHIRIHAHQIKS